jgi:hypothetical protein
MFEKLLKLWRRSDESTREAFRAYIQSER